MAKRSTALFYRDPDGSMQDAKIHDRIVAEGDRAAADAVGITQARRAGLTEQQISALYGSPHGVIDNTQDKMPPRSLYVRRDVLNAEEILAHFRSEGLEGLEDAAELHVTVCYSRTPVDWLSMGEARWNQDERGRVRVAPGGPRYMDRLGPQGEHIVMAFACDALSYRHGDMLQRGATSDYPEYIPHMTIVKDAAPEIDVTEVARWDGEILLGPEVFEEVKP